MKAILVILLCFLLFSCANTNLVYFANNYQEIARTDDAVPTLSSRVIKVREFGECTNSSCPKEVLYITISEFGEYPEQRLYQTKKADEWQFIEWNHIPPLGEQNPTISFTMKSVNNNIETNYSVRVNLKTIEYKIINQ